MNNFGLIQVYTGDGKGKTTASLGLAFRAMGHGYKVCMIQFMKDDAGYGEVKLAASLPNMTVLPVGRNDFVNLSNPETIDIQLAQAGWEKAKKIIMSREYDIVILDEINVAIACKLIDKDDVVAFLKGRRPPVEIVMTGRYAADEVVESADLVTEMKEIKHYYSKGVQSRDGIDH